MAVSEATIDDIRELTELGRRFHREAPTYSDLPFEFVKTAAWIAMHIEREDMVCFVSKNKGGELRGMMFGQLQDTFFGPTMQAIETTFYVAPEYRGGTTAAQLLTAFIAWGKENGAKRMIVTPSSGLDHAKTKRFLEHFDFREAAIGMIRDG